MSKILVENINRKLLFFFLLLSGVTFFAVVRILYSENQKEIKTSILKPAWERKIDVSGQPALKFGIITDTHTESEEGSSGERFLEEKYQSPFSDFVSGMEKFNPEFVVHLGDIIQEKGEGERLIELGIENLKLAKAEMEKTDKPVYWVIGNHDLRAVARKHFLESLDIDYLNKSFDYGPYRFIILDAGYQYMTHLDNPLKGVPSNPAAGDYVPGFVPEETLLWLEKKLKTDKNVVVLCHYTFLSRGQTMKEPVKKADYALSLFDKYNVRAVFNGHIEKRIYSQEKNGIEFFSLPGTKKHERFPNSFYEITLENGEIKVNMTYRDPESGEQISEPFLVEDKMDLSRAEHRELEEQEEESEA
jgi:3',5'-cyclic AMP phosphodiesterase CpdA